MFTEIREKVSMGLLDYVEEGAEKERFVLSPEYIDTWACEVKQTGWHDDALVVH